jgi:EmrB/QacA subfamily drug resistance transporter
MQMMRLPHLQPSAYLRNAFTCARRQTDRLGVKTEIKAGVPARGAPRTPSTTGVLTSLALCMLLPALGTSIANVALPTLALAFGATFGQVQWVVLAYLLATTTLVVSVGHLGDIFGRRRLLLAGTVLFTAASLLCGAAPWLWLLIAARAAQGLGAAVMMALAIAFVGDAVPKDQAGQAMGLLGSLSAVGTALGPTLGGVLITALSWRAIFWVCVPLGAVALLLALRHLPGDAVLPTQPQQHAKRPRFDVGGTLLLALALAAYALAMTVGRGHWGQLNVALLLAAALVGGLFVWVEHGTASPLLRLAMFHNPVLSSGLAATALVSTVMMATLVVGPFYLSRALRLNAAQVGMALSVGPLAAALASVPAGRWVDRLGAERIAIWGLVQIAAGAAAVSLLVATLGVPGYTLCIVVMTTGYALFQTANNTAVMADVQPDQRGVTSGVLNLSRNLGFLTGASAMGAVFAQAALTAEVSTDSSTDAITHLTTDVTTALPAALAYGMRATFAVAALLVATALAITLARLVFTRHSARGPSRRPIEPPVAKGEAGSAHRN